MKKVKIVSDGSVPGTQVLDAETGEIIPCVRKVTWEIDAATGYAQVKLDMHAPMIEAEGELTHIADSFKQQIAFDGWPVPNVLRYLAEMAGIDTELLKDFLPLYIPPGGTEAAPYGPAGPDCPYPVVGRGMPMKPSHLLILKPGGK